MFKKYLWLSDTKLRKKAIFHCYRYAIKSLKSIEMNELRINLKKLIRDEMNLNIRCRKIEDLMEYFQILQSFNYMINRAIIKNDDHFYKKLIRIGYQLSYFQAYKAGLIHHSHYLMKKLDQSPQIRALSQPKQEFYRQLVQSCVYQQNVIEWQKYKYFHQYLKDQNSEKMDSIVDVNLPSLDQINQYILMKGHRSKLFQEIFASSQEKPKELPRPKKTLSPTYKFYPQAEMYEGSNIKKK